MIQFDVYGLKKEMEAQYLEIATIHIKFKMHLEETPWF